MTSSVEEAYPIIGKVVGDLQEELLTLSSGHGFVPMFFLRFEDKLNYVLSNKQHVLLKAGKDPITGSDIEEDKRLYQKKLCTLSDSIALRQNELNSIRKMSNKRKTFLSQIFDDKKHYVNDCKNLDKSSHNINRILETVGVPRNVGCSHTVLRSGYPEILHSWIMDPRTIEINSYPKDLFIYESTFPDSFIFFPLELSGVSLGICGLDKDVYIGPLREEACAIITRKIPELFSAITNWLYIQYLDTLNAKVQDLVENSMLSNQEKEKNFLESVAEFLHDKYIIYFFKETKSKKDFEAIEGSKSPYDYYHLEYRGKVTLNEWVNFENESKIYTDIINKFYEYFKWLSEKYMKEKEIAHELSEYPHVIGQYTFQMIKKALEYDTWKKKDSGFKKSIPYLIADWDEQRLGYFQFLRSFTENDMHISPVEVNVHEIVEKLKLSYLLVGRQTVNDKKGYKKLKGIWENMFQYSGPIINVKAHPSIIMSIMENLVSNSLKHAIFIDDKNEKKHRWGNGLEVYFITEVVDTLKYTLTYNDNGLGLTEQDLELVPKWRQGHSYIKRYNNVHDVGYGFRSLQISIEMINKMNHMEYANFDVSQRKIVFTFMVLQ